MRFGAAVPLDAAHDGSRSAAGHDNRVEDDG